MSANEAPDMRAGYDNAAQVSRYVGLIGGVESVDTDARRPVCAGTGFCFV